MTIKDALEGLLLDDYQHVVVRKKDKNKFEYLGGGSVSSVIHRFGDRVIQRSYFCDGVLILFVL